MTINVVFAYALALAAALTAGLVGAFALMKRMSLAADALSHVALPGLGLALLTTAVNPIVGGAATLIVGTILVWHLEKHTGLSTETTIGVVFSASLAIGALITPGEELLDAIFGGFKEVSLGTFVVGTLITAAIVWFVMRYKDQLIITLFSQDLGGALGINTNKLNLAYLLVFSLTIILGLQFLGAALAGSLIIIPAATARRFSERFPVFLIGSSLVALVSVAGGLILSSLYHLNLGPTVITVASGLFILSLFKKHE